MLCAVSYIELSLGFALGWLAPILKSLEDPNSVLPLTASDASWIASLHELGRFFGPPVAGLLLDEIGRKIILIIYAVVTLATWIGVLFTKSIPILYGIRFVFGIGVGMCDVVTSIYIAENCSPEIRGIFCGITVVFFYCALVFQYVIASYLSYNAVALINLLNGVLLVASTVLIKEPIQFLLMKGQVSEARKTFKYLKGEENWDFLKTEFEIIQKHVEEEKQKNQSLRNLLSNPNNQKSILIVFILNILTMATGYGPVMAFVTKIIPASDSFSSYEFTIWFGIVQLTAVFLSLFIIDRFDRRSLLKFLFFAIALIHLGTAMVYHVYQDNQPTWYSLLILTGLASFAFMYGIIEPIIHITRGELFPQSVKAIGGCLSIMANASMGFLTIKMFLVIADNYGIQYNFVMFSIVSFIALIFTHYFLPEARAKTLVDIHKES